MLHDTQLYVTTLNVTWHTVICYKFLIKFSLIMNAQKLIPIAILFFQAVCVLGDCVTCTLCLKRADGIDSSKSLFIQWQSSVYISEEEEAAVEMIVGDKNKWLKKLVNNTFPAARRINWWREQGKKHKETWHFYLEIHFCWSLEKN